MIRQARPANHNGFSLIELLIVVTIFIIIALVAVSFFLATIIGGNRTASGLDVKQNGDHAISLMSFMIRNSQRIIDCQQYSITILNRDNGTTTFALAGAGNQYIASNSAAITSVDLRVNPTDGNPPGYPIYTNSDLFVCDPAPPDTKTVTIRFLLRKGTYPNDKNREIVTQVFSTTVGLRKF